MPEPTELLPPEVLNLLRSPKSGAVPTSLQGRVHWLLTNKGEMSLDDIIVGMWLEWKFVVDDRIKVSNAIRGLSDRGLVAKRNQSIGTFNVPVWRVV